MFQLLTELYIENLAVIKNESINFGDKLNVFTGETGAGKSILISGINAILGNRVTKDIVRNGTKKAFVSATFSFVSDDVASKLKEFGFNLEDGTLIVSREINSDGGSVARINSRPANISILKEIGQNLINIHGQHDNQILLLPENHINILDEFAENKDAIFDYKNTFRELQEIARVIKKTYTNEENKNRRIEELNEIIEQFSEFNFVETDEIEIEEKFARWKNSSEIIASLKKAAYILNGDDEEKGIVLLCDDAAEELGNKELLVPELTNLKQRLKNVSIELDDIYSEVSHIEKDFDLDEEKFADLKNKFEQLTKIKRKFGPTLREALEKYQAALDELSILENAEEKIEQLLEQKDNLLKEVTKKAEKLSNLREKAAKKFISTVENELKFLDMPNVKFDISHAKGKLTINGMDSMEFLISVNKGEPPKPIVKIASGGELSRIMLAFKAVLAEKDNVPTLIFDEIDTGVSGRAAGKIGVKLEEIGKHRQVLCVTHLAQIAVMADTHLNIEKKNVGNSTVTTVKILAENDRKYEIARIMGGDKITDLMLKNAEELIVSSKNSL